MDTLQRDLGVYKPRGRDWSVREIVWKEEGPSEESKTQMMYESLSGKTGAKMHKDWLVQCFGALNRNLSDY